MININILNEIKSSYPNIITPSLADYYSLSSKMLRIYGGDPDWKFAKKGGLYQGGTRSLAMLGTAKVLCDSLSTLTFTEPPTFIIDNPEVSDYVNNVFAENNLFYRMSEILSYSYALGGCFFRPFIKDNKILIDCIYGDDFIPTSWDNFGILEGCFISSFCKNGVKYVLFERHSIRDNAPLVENTVFCADDDSFTPFDIAEIFPNLKDEVYYDDLGIPVLFSHFKPANSNNIFPDLPLGISVFANAIDTIKALDIAFDSLSREFVLGRKRIIVPSSCVQTVVDISTGQQRKYFDADDEAYVALKCDEERDLKITDNTVELRIEEHISAINALLNILCFQTGLSIGSFSFDGNSAPKTATEIISRDNKTASTIKHNKNNLSFCLVSLAKTIIALGAFLGDLPEDSTLNTDVKVVWDDSIIVDSNTVIDNNIKLVSAGLKSKSSAISEIIKCDRNSALDELRLISDEKNLRLDLPNEDL